MVQHYGLALLGACSVALCGCVEAPGHYGFAGYGASAPPAARPSQVAALTTPGTAVSPPLAIEPAPGPIILPPLALPIREAWSSAKCPDLAVTFSGRSQPARSSVSDAAAFQEARQYREGEYYEVAECFCTKGGNLSETTRSAADTVMAQTAQQFADTSHMRIRRTGFIQASALGKYSELEAAASPPSNALVTLRTYWRGQCSMRLATMSAPATEIRAAQFLNSLHEVKAPAAAEAAPQASAQPATGEDFGTQVARRAAELNAGTPPAPAASDNSSAAAESALTPDATARLRQLQDLNDRGLITKEEYADKRRAILNGL